MKTDTPKGKGGLFGRIRTRMSGSSMSTSKESEQEQPSEKAQIIEAFEAVKKKSGSINRLGF